MSSPLSFPLKVLLCFLICGLASKLMFTALLLWFSRRGVERMKHGREGIPRAISAMNAIEHWTWQWFPVGVAFAPILIFVFIQIGLVELKWLAKGRSQK